ncbi:MAG: DNA-processing protein DprA, partial [Oscillospiraceae bacterium]|nr:DNA-processing protein DprA [Oscillospiraceae bacterium]
MAALRYWIWISRCCSARISQRLISHFGDPERVFFAEKEEIVAASGAKYYELEELLRKNLTDAKKTAAICSEKGYRILTIGDADYPERLRNISDPPTVLYVTGTLPNVDDEVTVGIVGTRKCTGYGTGAADKLGSELAKSGCVVV